MAESNRGAVVVTGASTGIGRAAALRLARAGHRVFAGVRKPADGEGLRAEAGGASLEPVILDVADGASVAAAKQQVEAALGGAGLAGLVNNAGIAVGGPIEFLAMGELQRQFDVNLFGQVAVTQAFLPALRRARGRVVFVSSIGGRLSQPILGPYSASKFALEAIADSLRVELRSSGVDVVVIQPGAVKTAIWDKGKHYADEALGSLPEEGVRLYGDMGRAVVGLFEKLEKNAIPAENVAAVIETALTARSPRARYVVGLDAKVQALVAALVPDRWRDAAIAWAIGAR